MRTLVDHECDADGALRRTLVESLYVDAMLLADEAWSAFAGRRASDEEAQDKLLVVGLACESLKTTTRLMHIIAWLLHRRAMLAGEPGAGPGDSAARIGPPITADWSICLGFDTEVRRIVAASESLFDRIARLEVRWDAAGGPGPVQMLLSRLAARY